jgi:hypothetical protein
MFSLSLQEDFFPKGLKYYIIIGIRDIMPIQHEEHKGKNVVVIDPQLVVERMLHYRERHQGWHIFRSVYWGIYLLVIGTFLMFYSQLGFTINMFFGSSLILFAVMLILFGLTEALHHKLMKRYG